MRRTLIAFALLTALLASGCWSSTRYTTAKTLEPGTSEFGVGFSALNVRKVCGEFTNETTGIDESECVSTGDTALADWWIPNIMPDLNFRFSLQEDLDLGFLVHFIGAAADVRWRFFHNEQFHLAIAPRLAADFPFMGIIQEYRAELPLLFTADFGMAQVYLSAAGSVGTWNLPFDTNGELDATTSGLSGVIGLQLGTASWFFRPEFGYTKHFLIGSGGDSTAGLELEWMHVGGSVGFTIGG